MSNYIFTLDDGGFVPVIIESRRGSHNITLRPKTAPEFEIHISKPFFVPEAQALKFLESNWTPKQRKYVLSTFSKLPREMLSSKRASGCNR